MLNLDENVMEEVMLLNRNSLRLLAICKSFNLIVISLADFAEKAKYLEPCKKIVLTDIVCSFCSNVVDVDLFRDRMFKDRNYECQICQNKYDEVLSLKIINVLEKARG